MKGAYVHIPFCEHICYYCDFNKYFRKNQPVDAYLDALNTEIRKVAETGEQQDLETLFVGGGTPTALSANQMKRLFETLRTHLYSEKIREWTVEANPENLDEEKLKIMKEAGVTRLSIGVQTFDDDLLKKIGRAHDRSAVFAGVRAARRAGFTNLSIDLMFGLPGQTMEQLSSSLDAAMAINPEHVSIYSLQVEPRTIFYNRMKQGRLKLPGEDLEAEMFDVLIDYLESRGLLQYEISNFARPGYESRHNLLYWNNEEYYGFGAGAHGYVNKKRIVNAGAVKGYIRRIRENGDATIAAHPVTLKEQIEEEMFLGLRKRSGVDKEIFYHKFSQTVDELFHHQLIELKEKGLILEDRNKIALTKKGLFLGNEVFQSFLLN
ncbi:radical SAM family heme chaperone HemW [Camelliibacillus cellulosilyticus]|uniref:Heme chaperone HemW n=1 Tax=Camelliibacillus cellulosilyticus TaxID=2174486 RepID=A0ABV9GJA4_9BACL